jgi:hypothetical protein
MVLRPFDGDPAQVGEFVNHDLAAETVIAAGLRADTGSN